MQGMDRGKERQEKEKWEGKGKIDKKQLRDIKGGNMEEEKGKTRKKRKKYMQRQ